MLWPSFYEVRVAMDCGMWQMTRKPPITQTSNPPVVRLRDELPHEVPQVLTGRHVAHVCTRRSQSSTHGTATGSTSLSLTVMRRAPREQPDSSWSKRRSHSVPSWGMGGGGGARTHLHSCTSYSANV